MNKKIHIKGNKTNKRRTTFADGSLERKVKRQEREQHRFDQETERLLAKYAKLNNEQRPETD